MHTFMTVDRTLAHIVFILIAVLAFFKGVMWLVDWFVWNVVVSKDRHDQR